MQQVNEDGLKLLETCEGLRLKAYKDVRGILTIGYGHTGPDVRPDSFITQQDAEKLLTEDIAIAKEAVDRLVKVPLTSNQFSALVCFVYNIGQGSFASSTLLRRLNLRDYAGAADEFLRWNKANGVPVAGLTARRKAEKALFQS